MSTDPLYDRILMILQIAAELGEHKRHDLDRTLGRSRGYLNRILRRDSPLRLDDLLRLIELLDIPPAEFFGPLIIDAGRGETPPSTQELLVRLSRVLGPSDPDRPEEDLTPSRPAQDLAPTVQELLQTLLREKGLLGEEP